MKTAMSGKQHKAYEIRVVSPAALRQAENIWSLAFTPGWISDYHRLELSTTYGAFSGDELHAVSAIIDLEMYFAGALVSCGGIGAVATMPGQRHQNLVTRLIAECLRDLHNRRVPLACLHAFSFPFYERMGFSMTHLIQEIDIATAFLHKRYKQADASSWRALPLDRCEETLPLHERMSRKFNLSVRRTPARCRFVTHMPGHQLQYFIHEDGYMLWDMGRSQNRKLVVLEFVHLSEKAYFDGLALLGQMEAQFDTVMWYDYDCEALLKNGIAEPLPSIKQLPWTMSRVVHLQQFEKLLPQPLTGLRVFDPLGVSAPSDGDIGPGELVQLVTGLWKQPDERFPANLHGIVRPNINYCIERF